MLLVVDTIFWNCLLVISIMMDSTDGATPHTADATITYIEDYFADRLMSRERWPAHSPYLTPSDFFLFGHFKNAVFRNLLHTPNEEVWFYTLLYLDRPIKEVKGC